MNTKPFNILDYPLCLERPRRLTDVLSWQEHIPFAFVMVAMAQPRVLVELGTHKGDSYCVFCQAVQKLDLACACYAVDTWEGDEEAGFYGPEVLEELRAHHDPLYGEFSRLMPCRFDEALAAFADGSVDLLHIDGLHTLEAVRRDFETWLPKLSAQAVVLFHDTAVRDKGFGVWRLWEDLCTHYANFEFHHGNGLGVLGVGNNLPERLEAFFSMTAEQRRQTADLFFLLGSRLTTENRLRREFERAGALKDKTIEELTRHSENLTTMLSEKDAMIHALTEHGNNLAAHGRNLEAVIHDQTGVIERTVNAMQRQNEALKDFESRLLSSLERNSFLVGELENLEAHLKGVQEHTANLEKIVNHPVVRLLRASKRTFLRRSRG